MASFMDVVEFEIGGSLYAMDISYAREIIEMTSITRLPRSPGYIAGIINLRGEILNVIDINSVLNLPPSKSREGQKIIVLIPDASGGSNVGVIVDKVHSVLQIAPDDIESIGNDLIGTEFIKGVVKQKAEGAEKDEPPRLIIWLDMAALLEGFMGAEAREGPAPKKAAAIDSQPVIDLEIELPPEADEPEGVETAVPESLSVIESDETLSLAEEGIAGQAASFTGQDPIDEFLTAACRPVDESVVVSAKDLFDAYTRWAEGTGKEIMTRQKFGRALSKREIIKRSKDSKGLIIYRGLEIVL